MAWALKLALGMGGFMVCVDLESVRQVCRELRRTGSPVA